MAAVFALVALPLGGDHGTLDALAAVQVLHQNNRRTQCPLGLRGGVHIGLLVLGGSKLL
jgi:hypothetical protein